jgi:hypothetical protein
MDVMKLGNWIFWPIHCNGLKDSIIGHLGTLGFSAGLKNSGHNLIFKSPLKKFGTQSFQCAHEQCKSGSFFVPDEEIYVQTYVTTISEEPEPF